MFNVFIDDHAPRHIQAMLEFIRAHPHDHMFNRRDLCPRAIQIRLNQRIKSCTLLDAAAKKSIKVHGISFREALQIARKSINLIGGLLAYEVLIQPLHCKLASACAGRAHRSFADKFVALRY